MQIFQEMQTTTNSAIWVRGDKVKVYNDIKKGQDKGKKKKDPKRGNITGNAFLNPKKAIFKIMNIDHQLLPFLMVWNQTRRKKKS